jgi:hypothetical protein
LRGHKKELWNRRSSRILDFPPVQKSRFNGTILAAVANRARSAAEPADRVKALTIYLGTIPVGSYERNSVIFYFYSTETIPYSDGFRINGGPASTLSCDVSGMKLDYSGPPIGIPMPQGGASNTK